MAEKKFVIKKEFTGGLLKGIIIDEITSVEFPVGFNCFKPLGGSSYRIVSCKEYKLKK